MHSFYSLFDSSSYCDNKRLQKSVASSKELLLVVVGVSCGLRVALLVLAGLGWVGARSAPHVSHSGTHAEAARAICTSSHGRWQELQAASNIQCL